MEMLQFWSEILAFSCCTRANNKVVCPNQIENLNFSKRFTGVECLISQRKLLLGLMLRNGVGGVGRVMNSMEVEHSSTKDNSKVLWTISASALFKTLGSDSNLMLPHHREHEKHYYDNSSIFYNTNNTRIDIFQF